jgi:four helix bundle protein
MNIAEGSLEECRYYLLLAADLNYCDTSNLQLSLDEVGRLLYGCTSAILNGGIV